MTVALGHNPSVLKVCSFKFMLQFGDKGHTCVVFPITNLQQFIGLINQFADLIEMIIPTVFSFLFISKFCLGIMIFFNYECSTFKSVT